MRTRASFKGLSPASRGASEVARRSSIKRDTKCELLLRCELWRRGLRYRLMKPSLPGRPDMIFGSARVVVFCDGDFWHGRGFTERIGKLEQGHNASYWVRKITENRARDLRNTRLLEDMGWTVLRLWEGDILRDVGAAADRVQRAIEAVVGDRSKDGNSD